MVVTARLSPWTANSEQDLIAMPSIRTVQAPHWLVSQPTCVPVSPSSSRRKWTSNIRGSTSRVWATPLTWIVTELTWNPLPGAGTPRPVRPGGRYHPTGDRSTRVAAQSVVAPDEIRGHLAISYVGCPRI